MLKVQSGSSGVMQPLSAEVTNGSNEILPDPSQDEEAKQFIMMVNNEESSVKEGSVKVVIGEEEEDDVSEEIQELINEGLSNLGYPASGVGQVFLSLSLSGKSLEDVEFLSKFEHLQVIDVSNNSLTDLDVLRNLNHLISLNASYNDLTEIIAFNPPLHIREMNYSQNKIQEISDLSCHSSLHTLLLDNNYIEEITGLEKCRSLRNLSLSNNKITKLAGIDGLRLRQLDLCNNEIKKIENLQNLKIIQYINLSYNSIRSLRGLQEHQLLEDINLENNQILDVSEIRYLRDLRLLRILNLSENPIQQTVDYRLSTIFKLPMLVELDLVSVYPEEKIAANNLFNPSMELLAARDHMYNTMKYFQHPQKLLDSTLPNYEPYPMLVITGPIGLGKKALAHKLCQTFPAYFNYCIAHTTREPCGNPLYITTNTSEEDGVHYNFVTVDEFEKLRFEGEFLQTCTKHGHQYGISRESIEKVSRSGLACVLTMELQGVMAMKQTHYEPRIVLLVSRDLKSYKQALQNSNRYTESQIDESLSDNETYIETHREKPGYFDAVIATADFDERYEELKTTVMDYLGLTPPNTSTTGSVLSLSALSRKSTSRLLTSSQRYSSYCTLGNDSLFTVAENESILTGRTAADVSHDRRFEETKSAVVGMTSFDEQISKVRDPVTPSTPNIIPYVEGYEDITQLEYQEEMSPEKTISNFTAADEDVNVDGQSSLQGLAGSDVEGDSSEISMVINSNHI